MPKLYIPTCEVASDKTPLETYNDLMNFRGAVDQIGERNETGDIVIRTTKDGNSYKVVDPDSSDYDSITSSGIKIQILPNDNREYSLTALGIDLTGSTNESNKVQTLIDRADANGGGVIVHPGGVVQVAGIEGRASVSLIGVGEDATYQRGNDAGLANSGESGSASLRHMFSWTKGEASDIRVEGLKFDINTVSIHKDGSPLSEGDRLQGGLGDYAVALNFLDTTNGKTKSFQEASGLSHNILVQNNNFYDSNFETAGDWTISSIAARGINDLIYTSNTHFNCQAKLAGASLSSFRITATENEFYDTRAYAISCVVKSPDNATDEEQLYISDIKVSDNYAYSSNFRSPALYLGDDNPKGSGIVIMSNVNVSNNSISFDADVGQGNFAFAKLRGIADGVIFEGNDLKTIGATSVSDAIGIDASIVELEGGEGFSIRGNRINADLKNYAIRLIGDGEISGNYIDGANRGIETSGEDVRILGNTIDSIESVYADFGEGQGRIKATVREAGELLVEGNVVTGNEGRGTASSYVFLFDGIKDHDLLEKISDLNYKGESLISASGGIFSKEINKSGESKSSPSVTDSPIENEISSQESLDGSDKSGVLKIFESMLNRTISDKFENLSDSEVAKVFTESQEFQNSYADLSNEDFITHLFRNIFSRDPAPSGLSAWTAQLTHGVSRAEVIVSISETSEYIFQEGMSREEFSLNSNSADWSGEIYRIFGAVLGREPSVDALERLSATLAEGHSLSEVIAQVIASPEFSDIYGDSTNPDFITLIFENALGRPPLQSGLDAWTARLTAGESRSGLVEGFIYTPEYVLGSIDDLVAYLNARDKGHSLISQSGDRTLSAGYVEDEFVFVAGQEGVYETNGLDPWDKLTLEGFDYTSNADALEHFTQYGSNVVFSDQGVTIVLNNWHLDDVNVDMFDFY
ncbi:DUF4214 domain-containing protein [Sagittula salina]|uniref:DUF4214 domain-containing protein n=1 Tax=Sagittula salina TaxID=2820268 RepID=A0A940S1S0_9RHOB|nr:DUF4214 domain-containing protein [Sagittula salina]MBP0484458.1 DUF4214 domain-containing protein [Sagittula salina]